MKIGIAGTGKMGTAIAGRLKSLGHEVLVWNRTAAKANAAIQAGATWAATPKDLLQQSDIVICLLTNEQALDDVYGSPQGLLAAVGQGKLIIEMSTVSPDKQTEMAKRVAQIGAKYLECPVGGSIGPAKEGKLLGFVGGRAEDLALAQPVLEQLCRRIEHIGDYGAGSMMKLASASMGTGGMSSDPSATDASTDAATNAATAGREVGGGVVFLHAAINVVVQAETGVEPGRQGEHLVGRTSLEAR